jgi:hypothetical protein
LLCLYKSPELFHQKTNFQGKLKLPAALRVGEGSFLAAESKENELQQLRVKCVKTGNFRLIGQLEITA